MNAIIFETFCVRNVSTTNTKCKCMESIIARLLKGVIPFLYFSLKCTVHSVFAFTMVHYCLSGISFLSLINKTNLGAIVRN